MTPQSPGAPGAPPLSREEPREPAPPLTATQVEALRTAKGIPAETVPAVPMRRSAWPWSRLVRKTPPDAGPVDPDPRQQDTRRRAEQDVLDDSMGVILSQMLFAVHGGEMPRTQDLQEMIDAGGRPNADTLEGEPLLTCVVRQNLILLSPPRDRVLPGLLALMDVLLDAGADPNRLDGQGRRPLHRATEPEVVQRLAQAGADPDALGEDGLGIRSCWTEELGYVRATLLDQVLRAAAETYALRRAVAEVQRDTPTLPAPVVARRRL